MIIAALSSVNLKEITADSDGFIRLSYFGRYATLARALLKDASVLLPDEASSALDVGSESAVQESLSRLVKGKTVLAIAHRMRTVENADKIVVLEGGAIAETGDMAVVAEVYLYV